MHNRWNPAYKRGGRTSVPERTLELWRSSCILENLGRISTCSTCHSKPNIRGHRCLQRQKGRQHGARSKEEYLLLGRTSLGSASPPTLVGPRGPAAALPRPLPWPAAHPLPPDRHRCSQPAPPAAPCGHPAASKMRSAARTPQEAAERPPEEAPRGMRHAAVPMSRHDCPGPSMGAQWRSCHASQASVATSEPPAALKIGLQWARTLPAPPSVQSPTRRCRPLSLSMDVNVPIHVYMQMYKYMCKDTYVYMYMYAYIYVCMSAVHVKMNMCLLHRAYLSTVDPGTGQSHMFQPKAGMIIGHIPRPRECTHKQRSQDTARGVCCIPTPRWWRNNASNNRNSEHPSARIKGRGDISLRRAPPDASVPRES